MMIVSPITRMGESLRFRMSEWMLAAVMFGWGISLAMPYNTFALPSMQTIAAMGFSETAWATACTVLGATRLVVLIVNGAWRRQGHARAFLAFLSCLIWAQIWIGLYTSGMVVPGQITYLIYLAVDLYAVFRAANDASLTDERHRNGSK